MAIRQRYGSLESFALRFPPAAQRICAVNTRRAVDNDTATFGRIVAAYGERGIEGVLNAHITDAITSMGEMADVDPADIRFTAEAICSNQRFRSLRFPSVFGFFHLLKIGEFDIYGKVTPRKILEAFRKYAERQQALEDRLAYEKQCRDEAQARGCRSKGAVSWAQYAAMRGIKDKDYMTYAARTAREYRESKTLALFFLGLAKELVSTVLFVSGLARERKIS